jgi:hypothetical protein
MSHCRGPLGDPGGVVILGYLWLVAADKRSSKKFCSVLMMQGRKLRRMKMRIRGVRRDNIQERRGDWVPSKKEEDFDF